MKIKLYNKIDPKGLNTLPSFFETGTDFTDENGILVRSADLKEEVFPPELAAIARAGAGVNNIPVARCTEEGICVFNTPGANAEAVTELCLAALFLTSRRLPDALAYTSTLAGNDDALRVIEKEKSRFAGPEIFGKTLGVIGLGAVGGKFASAAACLGMRVLGFDPFLSEKAAKALDARVEKTTDLDTVFARCDYISVHVPSLPSTRGMLCRANIEKMKPGVRLLNLARADLAVDEDILAALDTGRVSAYFTDFPTGSIAGHPGVVATPHLGASTPEAEENCAVMACREISDYLLNGNVENSVNFPALSFPRQKENRVGVLYRAGGDHEAALGKVLSGAAVTKAVRGEIAYLIAESDAPFDLSQIRAATGVIRVTAY